MGQTIRVPAADGDAEAYLTGSGPGVLLYIDAIGLRPRIEEMADEIASWGYTVLAPNVFYRDGEAADLAPTTDLRVPENREAFFRSGVMDLVAGLTAERTGPDADAWVAALDAHADGGDLGVVGFCMGARLALRTAGRYADRVRAVGGFHGGGLVSEDPDSPHRSIAGTRAAYVLLHADHDGSLRPEHVDALERELTAAGVPHVNEIVPDAPHGYTMSDTSSWHADGTRRAFAELRRLLDGALGA